MPLLGHGFVGVATAMVTRPRTASPIVHALWLPAVVVLAYLPDVADQLCVMSGLHVHRALSQSVGFAIAASLVVAGLAKWLGGLRFRHVLGVSLLTILLHDILDLLQTTDRMPLWPFWPHAVGPGRAIIPQNPRDEGLLFGGLFAVFLTGWFVIRRRRSAPDDAVTSTPASRRLVWLGNLLAVGVFVLAGFTYVQRSQRARQLEEAWALFKAKDYDESLARFDQAERWPGAGLPGRIDYGRAEAYLGRGDREKAEFYYLIAIHADPTYFRPLTDLVLLYVTSSEPAEVRRARAGPYLDRLRTDFADEPDYARIRATLERKLTEP